MKQSKKFRPSRQGGSTLIEAIIAIGILGIVVGTASTYFAQVGSETRVDNVKEIQTAIAGRIQSTLANRDALAQTLQLGGLSGNNRILSDCFLTACGAGGSPPTNEDNALPFTLIDAQGQRVAGNGFGYYDFGGNPCTGGTPNCFFKVNVKFWATCPLTAAGIPKANCGGPAKYLNFKYQVVPQTNLRTPNDLKKRVQPYPSNADYANNALSAVRLRAADVVETLAADDKTCKIDPVTKTSKCCPIGQKMTGVDPTGNPVCSCISPVVVKAAGTADTGGPNFTAAKNPDGSPQCAAQVCNEESKTAPEIMIGYRKATDGTLMPDCISQASCAADKTGKCPCVDIPLDSDPDPNDGKGVGDCGPGFWMVSINFGECSASKSKNKTAPETVSCTQKTGRCCKLDIQ